MAADAGAADKTYTLANGNETYTSAVTLTTANSPSSVVIDGGGRVVTGSANTFTVVAGVTITLKNFTFKTLPFNVEAGASGVTVDTGAEVYGSLEAGASGITVNTGAVVRENAVAEITVSGTSATVKGTLEMKAGALVTENHTSAVTVQANGVFTMSVGGVVVNSG
jgi:hypothetical protein